MSSKCGASKNNRASVSYSRKAEMNKPWWIEYIHFRHEYYGPTQVFVCMICDTSFLNYNAESPF